MQSFIFFSRLITGEPSSSGASSSDLNSHLEGHEEEKIYTCSECKAYFSEPRTLQEHMQVHTGNKPYGCSQCPESYQFKIRLLLHEKTYKFNESDFLCNLNNHLEGHEEKKNDTCSDAQVDFSEPSTGTLQQHMQLDTEERPYGCSHCPESFRFRSCLLLHEETHKFNESSNSCSEPFISSSNFEEQFIIYKGASPYVCDQCGKSYTQAKGLKSHKRVHTGMRPFGCKQCGRSFTWKGDLKRHTRVHTATERPFVCDQCGKSYYEASKLASHLRDHTGERPFVCDQCAKAFTELRFLQMHMQVHTGERRLTSTLNNHQSEKKNHRKLLAMNRKLVHL